MRLKELRGLPVIDPTAARKIGTVVDYQVDPASGRLAALDITGAYGDGNDAERVLAQRIRRVGRHAVILTARGGATSGTAMGVSERWLDLSTLVGLEGMGDDGNRIGRLIDGVFDQDTLEINAYLLQASLWERLLARRGRIQPARVHSCSRELMMVTTGHLKEQSTTVDDTTAPLNLSVPLKVEDRLPTPSYEQVPDGQPVGSRGR
jgi:sporulation protein YlmC with PRC-barrel domain